MHLLLSLAFLASAVAVSPTSCPGGYYLYQFGYTSISGDTAACYSCLTGSFSAAGSSSTCTKCALGTTSNVDKTACVACPAGKYARMDTDGGYCNSCYDNTFSAGRMHGLPVGQNRVLGLHGVRWLRGGQDLRGIPVRRRLLPELSNQHVQRGYRLNLHRLPLGHVLGYGRRIKRRGVHDRVRGGLTFFSYFR